MTTATTEKEAKRQEAVAEPRREVPTVTPVTDIYDTGRDLVIVAEMPGVDEKHVEVTLENSVLTLRGTSTFEVPEGLEAMHEEFGAPVYERSFTIREDIEPEKVRAAMKNGILRVTLPRSEAKQPRKISVTAE